MERLFKLVFFVQGVVCLLLSVFSLISKTYTGGEVGNFVVFVLFALFSGLSFAISAFEHSEIHENNSLRTKSLAVMYLFGTPLACILTFQIIRLTGLVS